MDKKKIAISIFLGLCIIIIIICVIIQVIMKKETEKLETESEKFNTFITITNGGTEVKTDYIQVEDNTFFVKVPTSFKQLTSEEISQKYSNAIPNEVFSNEEGTINVTINITEKDMKNEGIKNYLENLLKENNGEIITSNYYEVDNHNVGQIKLISNGSDSKIYNNTIFFSYNDKLVIITFNCLQELQEEWQKVGDFVIDSLFFAE